MLSTMAQNIGRNYTKLSQSASTLTVFMELVKSENLRGASLVLPSVIRELKLFEEDMLREYNQAIDALTRSYGIRL